MCGSYGDEMKEVRTMMGSRSVSDVPFAALATVLAGLGKAAVFFAVAGGFRSTEFALFSRGLRIVVAGFLTAKVGVKVGGFIAAAAFALVVRVIAGDDCTADLVD